MARKVHVLSKPSHVRGECKLGLSEKIHPNPLVYHPFPHYYCHWGVYTIFRHIQFFSDLGKLSLRSLQELGVVDPVFTRDRPVLCAKDVRRQVAEMMPGILATHGSVHTLNRHHFTTLQPT